MARRFRPLTVERVDDLPEPCCECALWEATGMSAPACGPAGDRAVLEAWLSTVLEDWGPGGLVLYDGATPLGFVKYAPARFFPCATGMPSGVPDRDAVLIACLHVGADLRDVGLGKVLLQAALRDLVSRKEKVVEAYAATEGNDRDRSPLMSLRFLMDQGFKVVRPHPLYPLMRLELKSLATWTENLEAALEAIQLPRRLGERVPAPLTNATDYRKASR
jgi:N-acetylglutamate synthase-like GNAT family acetyltransferase